MTGHARPVTATTDPEELARRRFLEDTTARRWRRGVVDFVRRRPLGAAGAAVIILMIVAAALADVIAPYDPYAQNFTGLPLPPSLEHLFGTDPFGRDVFSRILFGARTALLVGFTSSIVGSTLGFFLGGNVIAAITVPVIPRVARVTRASGLAVVQMPYIEAARSVGVRAPRIMFRHIAPNVFAPYLILLTAFLGQAVLLEATLSFLGLGVVEPEPAWGNMLRGQGMQFLDQAPWLAIAPGFAISLAVFGFNLFGDSLRDALDPKLRTA